MRRLKLALFYALFIQGAAQADDYVSLEEPADHFEQYRDELNGRSHSGDREARLALLDLLNDRGYWDEGLDLVGAWLETAPDDQALQVRRTRLWIGRIASSGVFRKLKSAKRMRAACEAELQHDPKNAAALQCLAQFHLNAPGIAGGNRQEADQLIQRLADIDPARHAFLLFQQVDPVDAEKQAVYLTKAADAGASPHILLTAVRTTLANQQFDLAFQLLEQLRADEISDPEIDYQFGRAAALSGVHPDEGKQALMRFLRNDHTWLRGEDYRAEAHAWLGRIFEREGADDIARTAYARALELEKKLDLARAGMDRVG